MKANLETTAQYLIRKKLTIAFAESATAGRLAAEFSLATDAGKFLKGGLVCYDAALKETLLQVPKKLVEACSPESLEVTRAIADGLAKLIPADLHVGITGLTCPGGSESPEKPVGTMFIHCNYRTRTLFSERIVFKGNQEEIVLQTVEEFNWLLQERLIPRE